MISRRAFLRALGVVPAAPLVRYLPVLGTVAAQSPVTYAAASTAGAAWIYSYLNIQDIVETELARVLALNIDEHFVNGTSEQFTKGLIA